MIKPDSYKLNITSYNIASLLTVSLLLILILQLHLLAALLTGLMVYEVIHSLSGRMRRLVRGMSTEASRMVVTGLFITIIVGVIIVLYIVIHAFFRGSSDNLPNLLHKMADIIDTTLLTMPPWISQKLPPDAFQAKALIVKWFRAHARELQTMGKEALKTSAHILIGIVVGILIALDSERDINGVGPYARALNDSVIKLETSFRYVVFAQMKISALNTSFAAIYLVLILPLFDIHIPLVKTLIAITFVAGLLPVVGNLISNTVIIIVSMSNSFTTAIASLIFLVVIHKFEYFLNARIVGTQTKSRAWEILLAMTIMETLFGLPGVAAASIYYAYLKSELKEMGLV